MALDLAGLDDAMLVRELVQKQHALVGARFSHSMSKLENTATLRVIRKDIARIRTEIRRRELDAGLGKDDLLRRHPVNQAELEKGAASTTKGGLLAGVVDKLAE